LATGTDDRRHAGISAVAVLVFVVSALALYTFRPAERARIRSAILLFVFSVIAMALAVMVVSFGAAGWLAHNG